MLGVHQCYASSSGPYSQPELTLYWSTVCVCAASQRKGNQKCDRPTRHDEVGNADRRDRVAERDWRRRSRLSPIVWALGSSSASSRVSVGVAFGLVFRGGSCQRCGGAEVKYARPMGGETCRGSARNAAKIRPKIRMTAPLLRKGDCAFLQLIAYSVYRLTPIKPRRDGAANPRLEFRRVHRKGAIGAQRTS